MYPRGILTQLRVKRGYQLIFLAGGYDVPAGFCQNLCALSRYGDVGRPDKGHRYSAQPLKLLFRIKAAQLSAIGIPLTGNIHRREAGLSPSTEEASRISPAQVPNTGRPSRILS